MRSPVGVSLWKWAALVVAVILLVLAFVRPGSSKNVATVDGHGISLASYQDWLSVAAQSAHTSDKDFPAFVPDAPNYTRCIAFERTAQTKNGKSPSQASLKTDCIAIREELAEQTVEFLIGAQWFLDEGQREGVSVTDAQVAKTVSSSFPKSSGLVTFLNDSGMSRANLNYQAKVSLITQKLTQRHSGTAPTITSAEIQQYYDQYKSQIGKETLTQATPEIRQILISQAEAPTVQAWENQVQSYFQARTSCAVGYRVAKYCKAS